MLQFSQKGIITLPLVLAFVILIGLTSYAAIYSAKNQPTSLPGQSAASPSPSESPLPARSASQSDAGGPPPSPSPIVSPPPAGGPKPSVSPTPTPTNKPAAPVSNTPPGSGYSYITVNTEKGSFPSHVVVLNNPTMVTDTANADDCANDCPTIPLADFVSRNGGFAGINGSYFCPADYPDCAGKKNSFDFPVYNTGLKKWLNQGTLGWNGRSIVYQDGGGYHYMQNANGFGGGLNAGIVNYPGILNSGQVVVEDNSLSDKQRNAGTKGGIGLNGNTVYLVITPNVTMYEFALVFKALGAQSALNLDGGGSSALYFGGYKVGPGRNLPNAIIFK